MPTIVQAALLGVVQGVTEFLPVSSSAHLILARTFFGWDADQFGLAFDVACHVGTLVAVAVYFRQEVVDMVVALPRLFEPGPAQAGRHQDGAGAVQAVADRDGHQGARLVWLLVLATIPAVIVGLLFGHVIKDHMRTPQVAAATLAFGAFGLIVAERSGDQMRSDVSLTMIEAIWLGCAQALALIPGVSRSGATLTVALLIGLRRAEAARFIFLLSIPAIAAAAANEMPELFRAGPGGNTALLFLVAVTSSAIVSYATVKYFIRYLSDHSLNGFAWYRLALAAAVAIWLVR